MIAKIQKNCKQEECLVPRVLGLKVVLKSQYTWKVFKKGQEINIYHRMMNCDNYSNLKSTEFKIVRTFVGIARTILYSVDVILYIIIIMGSL